MMNKKCINPKELFNSTQYGFSQIVVSDPGKIVFISGQVAWDENLNIIGGNDLKLQTQKAIDNLKAAIESAGGSLENIVMLRIYKVDYEKEDGPVINEILKKYFGTSTPPASTWVSVKGLANEEFMVEIEAQAVI
jgi:2-iminobutanoate/2-iminopropanoate deaminase